MPSVNKNRKGSPAAKAHVKKRISAAKKRVAKQARQSNARNLRQEYLAGGANKARKKVKKMVKGK